VDEIDCRSPGGFATLSRTGAIVRRRARYRLEHRQQQNSLVKLDTGGRS